MEPLPASLIARLREAAALTLRQQHVSQDTEVTIMLTDDAQLQQLNRDYRGVDEPTDVLSFNIDMEMPEGHTYLGDIVIAVPLAESRARTAGHDLLAELALLVVHGILHLLGYDHVGAGDREAMWARQDDILAQLELKARPTET